jgi:hypothetical protein
MNLEVSYTLKGANLKKAESGSTGSRLTSLSQDQYRSLSRSSAKKLK